jgi:hypothetical protein
MHPPNIVQMVSKGRGTNLPAVGSTQNVGGLAWDHADAVSFLSFLFIPPAGHFGKYKASSSLVARYGAVASNRRVHVCGCKQERQQVATARPPLLYYCRRHGLFVIFCKFLRTHAPYNLADIIVSACLPNKDARTYTFSSVQHASVTTWRWTTRRRPLLAMMNDLRLFTRTFLSLSWLQ